MSLLSEPSLFYNNGQKLKPSYPRSILLAEDCPDTRALFSLILENAGFEVYTASDGLECLNFVLSSTKSKLGIDLILVDVKMPEIDGFTVAKLLRQEGYFMPIIAVTANSLLVNEKNALNNFCDEVIPKSDLNKTLIPLIWRFIN